MKLALTINNNKNEDVQIPLPSERCVIGRNADCDVRLPDASVSNHHAELVFTKDRCFIEDLQSTNGTYVNKRRVMRAELRDGDSVAIGRQLLTVQLTADERRKPVEQDDRLANQSSVQNVLLMNQLSEPSQRSSIVRAVARATVNDETQQAVRQLEQSVRRRGRSRSGELPVAILRLLRGKESMDSVLLDRPTIELSTGRRCIAYVSRRPSGYYFIPASETEVTRVNGIVSRPPGRALFHRDVIDVADVAMEFCFPDTEVAEIVSEEKAAS